MRPTTKRHLSIGIWVRVCTMSECVQKDFESADTGWSTRRCAAGGCSRRQRCNVSTVSTASSSRCNCRTVSFLTVTVASRPNPKEIPYAVRSGTTAELRICSQWFCHLDVVIFHYETSPVLTTTMPFPHLFRSGPRSALTLRIHRCIPRRGAPVVWRGSSRRTGRLTNPRLSVITSSKQFRRQQILRLGFGNGAPALLVVTEVHLVHILLGNVVVIHFTSSGATETWQNWRKWAQMVL